MQNLKGEEWIASKAKRRFDVGAVLTTTPALYIPLKMGHLASSIEIGENSRTTQQRHGLNGEIFELHKLKTLSGPMDNGTLSIQPVDERITRTGRLLRRAHIDELPQALNIIKGDMSLVGPRPLPRVAYEETMDNLSPTEQLEWANALAISKPGVFSEFALRSTVEESKFNPALRYECDMRYLENASLGYDLRIISSHFAIESLKSMGGNIEANGHSRSVSIVTKLAEDFGVNITERDRDLVGWAFRVAKILDTHVDKLRVVNSEELFDMISKGKVIQGMSESEAKAFASFYSTLNEAKRVQLRNSGSLSRHAHARGESKLATEYIETTFDESRLFAEVIALEVDDDDTDFEQRNNFNNWLFEWARAGYALDSFISDLSADKKANLITVDTRLVSRLKLASVAIHEVADFAQSLTLNSATILSAGIIRKAATKGVQYLLNF